MDFFDILLAKKLENDKDVSIVQLNVSENGTYSESGKAYSPVVVDVQPPSNSYLRTPIDSYPATAEQLPIPKCDVEIANQKSCKVFVSNKPFVNDKVPYLFRKSAGGDRVYEKLIGGTIAWNQLVRNGNFASTSGWLAQNSTISVTNNILSITSDTTSIGANALRTDLNIDFAHVVFASVEAKGNTSAHLKISFYGSGSVTQSTNSYSLTSSFEQINGIIKTNGTKTNYHLSIDKTTASDQVTIDCKNAICIDLTQMFGSTIADYIYSLEQATAGAGVAWFRTLFPNDYYAYDSGSLQSVNVASKKVVGFNQWDEEWEVGGINFNTGEKVVGTTQIRSKNPIKILSDKDYYLNFWYNLGSQGVALCFYDSDNVFISGKVKWSSNLASSEIPSNARYLMFGARYTRATYENDICINISDPAKNGTYEPYEEHTYEFDTDVTLRGLPKLDSNNNLYYDGDTYESNGTVTRRYGIVDLGTLDYERDTSYDNPFFYATIDDIGRVSPIKPKINIFCSEKYLVVDSTSMKSFGASADNNTICKEIGASRKKILIRDDSYTDAQAFKTAMSGIYLVYELATPTTESADAYTNPQIVDADGTEEFVDYAYSQSTREVAVPVGHDSLYYNGQLYQTDFAQATTDTINMAELHSIVPPSGEFYITSNGTLRVDVWKK